MSPSDRTTTGTSPATTRPRLAIVVSHPIQHFGPMYRSIAADGRVDLLVIFTDSGAVPQFDRGFGRMIRWQDDLLDGYAHVQLKATPDDKGGRALLNALSGFSPDVVYVHGYGQPPCRAAIRWANGAGLPVMMTTDSELLYPRPWWVRAMKRLVLPRLFRRVSLFLTVGDENERYFRHYGVPESRFHRIPFSIDSHFYDHVLQEGQQVRSQRREQLDITPDTVVLLTVGKLIPRKRQQDLIGAMAILHSEGIRDAVLLIAGDGPERVRLEELARPLGAAVRFLGFIDVNNLPSYYLAADCYVHPSDHDPHPLAISEALYCGLPVVASDRIGSVGPTDDVQPGRNGWVYRTGDVRELAEVLGKVIRDPGAREQAASIARDLGQAHAADRCATRFVDGTLRVLAASPGQRQRVKVT